MRFRLMATYRGAPYEAGIGPSDRDVVLFAACPPPEDLRFDPAPGYWRKHVRVEEVQSLWESHPVGLFRGEQCLVLDDFGDRLHIAYLGHDAYRAEQLGYWQVDRGVYELITPRDEVADVVEERHEYHYPYRTGPATGPMAAVGGPPADGSLSGAAQPPGAQPPGAARLPRRPLSPAPALTPAPGPGVTRAPVPVSGPALSAGSGPLRTIPRTDPATAPDRVTGAGLMGGPASFSEPATARDPGQNAAASTPASTAAPGWAAAPGGFSAAPEPAEVVLPQAPSAPLPLEAAALRAAARDRQQAAPPGGMPVTDPDVLARDPATAAVPPRRHRGDRSRTGAQQTFAELAAQAAIPPASYAIGAQREGALCLLPTAGGFEVFSCVGGARHEARLFADEESGYFYLFGVLAAEAVRTGLLAPRG